MPGIAIIIPRSGGSGPVIPAWEPSDLGSDLISWYDPRQGTDGENVVSLTSTGGGTTLDQITGSPVFDADGLGGTPAIRFDGASALVGTGSLSGELTIMVNCSITGPNTQYVIDGHGASVLSVSRSVWSDSFIIQRGGSNKISTPLSDSEPHTHIGVYAGGSSRYYVDGEEIAGPLGSLDATSLTIGAAGNLSSFTTGHVGDVLVASRALSADEAIRATGWMKARRNAL